MRLLKYARVLAPIYLFLTVLFSASFSQAFEPQGGASFTVVVYDGTTDLPVELAKVGLYRGKTLVKGKVTNSQGRVTFLDLTPAVYRLVVRSVGYIEFVDSAVTIDSLHGFDSITLVERSREVVVEGTREPSITTIEPISGNQVFEVQSYHSAPTARISQ